MTLKLYQVPQSPGGLVKTNIGGAVYRISDSLGLGKGLGTCVSNSFSADAVAGLETQSEKCWPKTFYYSSYPSG